MFSFIKGLLSSGDIVRGGMDALDKSFLTDEEKQDLKLEFIKATMPMNRARRFIAMIVSVVWAIHASVGTALLLTESALLSAFVSYMTTNISAPFIVIVGFYFWNEKLKVPNTTTKK